MQDQYIDLSRMAACFVADWRQHGEATIRSSIPVVLAASKPHEDTGGGWDSSACDGLLGGR